MDFLYPRVSADIVPSVSKDGALYRLREAQDSKSSKVDVGPVHPFAVYLSNPADPAAPKANIYAASRLYKSISTTNTQTITDLTTEFTLAANTCVWLEVTVVGLAVTAATRKTGTTWPSLVVYSGSPSAQAQYNVPIGRVAATVPTSSALYSRIKPGFDFTISGASYHFEQCLFSHLLSMLHVENNTPFIYALNWAGAVPS